MSWHVFNVMTSSRIFGLMTPFWHHDEIVEPLRYFWRYDVLLMSSHVFDVMTNFLTTWRKFWRYELLMLWRTIWGYEVINNIDITHNQIHTNTSEWWCGQALLGRYHVYQKAYTRPLYHSAYIYLFEIISAIMKMYDTLWKQPLAPPSRMLTSTYCTCTHGVFTLKWTHGWSCCNKHNKQQGNQRWQTSPRRATRWVGTFPYILTPIPNLYDHSFPRYGQITFLTFRRPTTLTFDLKYLSVTVYPYVICMPSFIMIGWEMAEILHFEILRKHGQTNTQTNTQTHKQTHKHTDMGITIPRPPHYANALIYSHLRVIRTWTSDISLWYKE